MIAIIIQVLQIGTVGEGGAGVTAANLMTANMIDGFLIRPVLSDGPGKELVEGVAGQPRAGQQIGADIARLGIDFRLVGGRNGIRGFVAPIKSAVGDGSLNEIRVSLLIPLQMGPSGKK